MAEHLRDADPSISELFAYCCPCFKDYMEILADLKRKKAA